jgi:hypothetical protein
MHKLSKFGMYRACANKHSARILRWSCTIVVSKLPFPSRVAAKVRDHFLEADLVTYPPIQIAEVPPSKRHHLPEDGTLSDG